MMILFLVVFGVSCGNLALAAQLKVNTVSNHAIITYVGVSMGIVFLGICCCCCCRKKCCKNDSSTQTEAAAPTVCYHDAPPIAPSCSGPVYPSAYPHEPGYQPVNNYPPPSGINVNQPQPGIMNVSPIPPGINVSPPLPGITMNPLQSEVAPPTDQGPPATPILSSELLSSDSEPRFELTGFSIPFAPPLSSDTPFCVVYNSDKLNFQ